MTLRRSECVIDTKVLCSANEPITVAPREFSLFKCRLRLLKRLHQGALIMLISDALINEYRTKVPRPLNEFVTAFLDIATRRPADRVRFNWKKSWPGGDRDRAFGRCRFPSEDTHLLRTAIPEHKISTFIITEENRILMTDRCIHREFRVHAVHTKDV